MALPPETGYRKFVLYMEDEAYGVLASYEILSFSGAPYMLNNYPYRKYGSNEQGTRGDGTLVIPNLTFEIRGAGDQLTVGRSVYREMQFTKFLRTDTFTDTGTLYASYRIPVAFPLGINRLERLTPESFRAEIEFVTTTAYWTNLSTLDELLGVI